MKTLLLTLCLSLAPLSAPLADTLHFVTEEYAPFNYTKDGKITGIAVEQVEAIAKAAGIDYTLEIMPWARLRHGGKPAEILRLHGRLQSRTR